MITKKFTRVDAYGTARYRPEGADFKPESYQLGNPALWRDNESIPNLKFTKSGMRSNQLNSINKTGGGKGVLQEPMQPRVEEVDPEKDQPFKQFNYRRGKIYDDPHG